MSELTIEDKLKLVVKNPNTLSYWLSFLRKFKATVGNKDAYDSWDALKFLEEYGKTARGKSARVAYNVMKRIYDIAGWEWDKNNIRPPAIDELSIQRPRLPEGSIEKMIANQRKLDLYRRGLLFLSTTYGLRRTELVSIRDEDINLDDLKILIRTAKGGVKRWQRLPEVAATALDGWETRKIQAQRMGKIFHAIVYLTLGMPLHGNHGWHDIRRELAIRLSPPNTDLTDYELVQFMRWSVSMGVTGQTLHEYRKSARQSDQFAIDEKILNIHPFVKKWEEILWRKG